MGSNSNAVNQSSVDWNGENGNFSFKTTVQMSKDNGYSLASALVSSPICGAFKGQGNLLTEDEKRVLEQTSNLAANAAESIPGGLDAIFDLMAYAQTENLSRHTITRLGFFLKDIVATMVQLNTLEANCDYALLCDERLKNKGGRDE